MKSSSSLVQGRILVVDDDEDVLAAARLLLKQHFSSVLTMSDPKKLPELVGGKSFDVLLLDMNFTIGNDSGAEGLSYLSKVLEHDSQASVVLLTAHSDVELAVDAMKKGATDFVTKPWENDRLVATIIAALNLRRSRLEATDLRERNRGLAVASQRAGGSMIGNSGSMMKVFAAISRAAPTDVNILILGENGTGKELVAREIHRQSQRSSEVFLRVDMGSISPQLFESELFGHCRGAFTDAKQDRTGYFRAATAGTLFLDEIGNVPLYLQSKLLTALERREVIPVGTEKPEPINVRLICATNLSSTQLSDSSRFRQDLFYRINTVEIQLPPLRQRKEDIPLLLEHFTTFYCRKYNFSMKRLAPSLIDRLTEEWPWPGNIRELRHAVERAIVLSENEVLTATDFPLAEEKAIVQNETSADISRLDAVEKTAIVHALACHNGNISRAADALGLTRASLYRRMEKYGL